MNEMKQLACVVSVDVAQEQIEILGLGWCVRRRGEKWVLEGVVKENGCF